MSQPAEASPPHSALEPPLSAEVESERQRWRESLLNGVFLSSAITGAAIALLLAQQGVAHRSLGAAAVSGVAISCIFSGRWLGFRLRSLLLMSSIYVACTVGLSADGFAPESLLGLAFMVALGTLLLGRMAGIAATGFSMVTLFVISLLHAEGILTRPPDWWQLFDTASSETAARVTVVFGSVCSALVIGTSHLIGRAETLLREKDHALKREKEIEAERERIRKRLDQHEREFRRVRELEALGRLAGFAAHDFNNTLYVIAGNAEIARRAIQRPEDVELALRAIEAATRDATTTSRQLLSINAHGSQGRVSVHPKAEAERVGILLQRILSTQIDVQVDAEPCPAIRADEGAIQRILLNLALNARDAMPDGGSLRIQVRMARPEELPDPLLENDGESYVLIAVEDTGTGMDEATVQQLFEPFFTTKGTAGNGLGLASAQSLAREAGGLIAVESHVDLGTRFSIFWPAESYEGRRDCVTEPAFASSTQRA